MFDPDVEGLGDLLQRGWHHPYPHPRTHECDQDGTVGVVLVGRSSGAFGTLFQPRLFDTTAAVLLERRGKDFNVAFKRHPPCAMAASDCFGQHEASAASAAGTRNSNSAAGDGHQAKGQRRVVEHQAAASQRQWGVPNSG